MLMMIGGVGGVLVFLPNILFLFFAIAILEDSGYMSRAAFVMDGIIFWNISKKGVEICTNICYYRCRMYIIITSKEGEDLENYTKYTLKPLEQLQALLAETDDIFVIACNKCFKEFTKV